MPDYALVHEKHLKEFVQELTKFIKKIYGEKPEENEDMGNILNEFHVKRLEDLIKTSGGKLLSGGGVDYEKKQV